MDKRRLRYFLDGNRTRIFSFSRVALTQLSYQFDNRSIAAHPKTNDGQEARWETQPSGGWGGARTRSRFPASPITQTQRPVEIGAPDGHRTHISRTESGRSIAVELRDCPRVRANFERRSRMRSCCRFRQSQMGKWRDRTEALHAGNRTRTATAFATDGTPSLWWRITDHLRPIEIGVTNRIRTGTNAVTGRDAAVTSESP